MLLNNVTLLNETRPVNISIKGERIEAVGNGHSADDHCIQFPDAIAIPGLINSHDHLDFNCFSPIGNKKYNNYTEWGNDIHQTHKDYINSVLKIPESLRTSWGMYKNLLAGITTVINHGTALKVENSLINIHQESQNLHSVKFQKNWKWKLNNPLLKNKICVIHAGEGVDEQSHDEINELIKYNLLKRDLVGVHGMAMNAYQAKRFKALIWCPESNRLLFDKDADIRQLKEKTRLVFGTDSTLTGNWSVWHHLRLARKLNQVSDAELFDMITSSPAKLWATNSGQLLPDKDADVVIVKKKKTTSGWNDFFSINPEDILMVVHKGKIRMFDKILLNNLNNLPVDTNRFSRIIISQAEKFVEGDLPALVRAIRSYNPGIEFPVNVIESKNRLS